MTAVVQTPARTGLRLCLWCVAAVIAELGLWLVEAASAGTSRLKVKMAAAVDLARLHPAKRVDWALGHAASYGRFAEGDLASILAANPPGQHRTANENSSLQPGTGAWERFGR